MSNPFSNFQTSIVFKGNDGEFHEYYKPLKKDIKEYLKEDFGWYGIKPKDYKDDISSIVSNPLYPFTQASVIRKKIRDKMPELKFDSYSGHSPLNFHHACYNFQHHFMEYAYDTGELNPNFNRQYKNYTEDDFVAAVLRIANAYYHRSNIKGEVAIRKSINNAKSNNKYFCIERKKVKQLSFAIADSIAARTKKYPDGTSYGNISYNNSFSIMDKEIQYAICYYFEVKHSSNVNGIERLYEGEVLYALHGDGYFNFLE